MGQGGWRDNGLWYGPLALMNLMRRELGPVAQTGMRRAVGAGQEDCPLERSATRILDVAATSRLVRGSDILAGMRITPTLRVAGGAGGAASGEGRRARAGSSRDWPGGGGKKGRKTTFLKKAVRPGNGEH